MLGMSATELVIILALALLLLGPDQLPSVAKALGKGLREIRKATDDLKSTFEQEMVKFEDEPKAPRMIAPPPADSSAALGGDPGAARAAARMAAAAGVTVPAPTGLVSPEGAVARDAPRPADPAPPAAPASAPASEEEPKV